MTTALLTLLSPAMRLMQGFRITHKVAFVAISFAIPLLIVVGLLFMEMRTEGAIAHKKLTALTEIQANNLIQSGIRQHRALSHMQAQGNKQVAEKLNSLEKQIHEQLQSSSLPDKLKTDWQSLIAAQSSSKPAQNFQNHNQFLEKIDQLSRQLANDSKLNLDADITTNQLLNMQLRSLPSTEEKLMVMTARGAAYIDSGLFEAGEDVMLNSLLMNVKSEQKQLLEQISTLEQEQSELKPALQAIRTALLESDKFFARAQDEVLASVNQSSGSEFYTAGTGAAKQIAEQNQKLATLIQNRLAQVVTALDWKIYRMFAGIFVLIAVATYLLAGIYFALSRDIHQLTASIQKTASGDLVPEQVQAGKDEISQLLSAVNQMKSGLGSLVADIRLNADSIDTIAKKIHQDNGDLSGRTESQAGSLEETASAVEQLTTTTRDNAANLAQASQLVSGSAQSVQEGLHVMSSAIESMQSITTSSKKISEIIGVMDSIAFQTNILALNAAVEAARAGQEGRGFAVVASEVRNLAQRSANAAKEIKHLIDSSGAEVKKGSTLINSAGKTMQDIAENVEQVSSLIHHVANASQEQSAGISSVNNAISSIDQLTQENASLVEQAKFSTEQLEQNAATLSKAVSAFRIQEHAAATIAHSAAPRKHSGRQAALRSQKLSIARS